MSEETHPLMDALETLGAAVVALAESFFEHIKPLVQWFEGLRSEYIEAGAPYGDTPVGMLRYFRELAVLRRTEQERQFIRERRWYHDAPMRFLLKKQELVGFGFSLN